MQSHAFLRRCSIITVAMRDSADRDLQQWVSGLGLRDASSPWNWVELSFIDNWLLQTLSSQMTAKLAAKVPPHRHPLYLVSYATPRHPPPALVFPSRPPHADTATLPYRRPCWPCRTSSARTCPPQCHLLVLRIECPPPPSPSSYVFLVDPEARYLPSEVTAETQH